MPTADSNFCQACAAVTVGPGPSSVNSSTTASTSWAFRAAVKASPQRNFRHICRLALCAGPGGGADEYKAAATASSELCVAAAPSQLPSRTARVSDRQALDWLISNRGVPYGLHCAV